MDFSAAGGGGGRGEPARWLEIAGKLLAARDLVGCKRLAERAVEADPNLPGADELLAVADVLLASQRQLPSGRPDPVAVLQLHPGPDPAAVKRAFSRLSQLVSAPRNPRPAADTALHFVQEAFADLSKNPSSDTPPAAASTPASGGASAAAAADADAFWTACPYCCHVYQYQRALVGRALRCQSAGCRRAFVAAEIPTVPPIVPGTDMYYCAWGFFPMGFPKAADLSTNWRPFCPMFPGNFQSPPQPASAGTANVDSGNFRSPPQPAAAGTANVNLGNFRSPPQPASAGTANVDPGKFRSPPQPAAAGTSHVNPRNFQSPPKPASAGTANVDPGNFRSPLQPAAAGTSHVNRGNFQSPPKPASAGTANVDVQIVENNGRPINANSTPANVQLANKSGVRGSAAGPSRGRMKKTTARKKVGAVLKKHASSGVESGIEPSMLGSDSWNGNAGSSSGQTVGTREININEVAKPTDGATVLNFGGDEDIGFDLDVDATDAILGNLQHLPFLREDDNTRRMF
ncbi:hypothetical protein SEVIR_2G404100v4 [Setaria viridis]|uniref:J domain-containing protein n=1 Tax=Setaria viridis TaxID=4556 RepID=A0A4U6W2M8_SETVI|nr:formin-like protein 16 [Setaria viridis]TKW35875.1 hypothetical protein SEVIR_2G404100v2 [Setaria viridis]